MKQTAAASRLALPYCSRMSDERLKDIGLTRDEVRRFR